MTRTSAYAVLASVGLCSIAAAFGGWATVNVENLPEHLVVDQPYNLTFSVRQHGEDLLADLSPYVEMRNGKSQLIARAARTNRAGYYTATLNVPGAGDWGVTIETSFGKSRLKLLPIAAVPAGAAKMASYSAAERGRRLFVAKGCVACHQHASVDGSGYYAVGPDLSGRPFAADYLKRFLSDPSIKPPTNKIRMPNPELSAAEIGALIAFINAEASRAAAAK
jgi:cytochrome c551/c552